MYVSPLFLDSQNIALVKENAMDALLHNANQVMENISPTVVTNLSRRLID
jgi:hypothetical protein